MEKREYRMVLQDLLQHKGWAVFLSLLLVDKEQASRVRKCLRTQVQDKINASARAGDWEKTAYYTGQLDIIELITKLPEKELQSSLNL